MHEFSTQAGDVTRLSGKIKWFNRSKGFGFIVPDDGTGDVFLPLAVLERAGHSEAPDGARITVESVQGPKGRAATHILQLDASTATPRPSREPRPPRRDREEEANLPTEAVDGVVKWYDTARGFGFVLPSDGGKDVFVHVTALHRAGIEELQPGQSVRLQVAQGRRGREALALQLLP
jgi:cold shock protein